MPSTIWTGPYQSSLPDWQKIKAPQRIDSSVTGRTSIIFVHGISNRIFSRFRFRTLQQCLVGEIVNAVRDIVEPSFDTFLVKAIPGVRYFVAISICIGNDQTKSWLHVLPHIIWPWPCMHNVAFRIGVPYSIIIDTIVGTKIMGNGDGAQEQSSTQGCLPCPDLHHVVGSVGISSSKQSHGRIPALRLGVFHSSCRVPDINFDKVPRVVRVCALHRCAPLLVRAILCIGWEAFKNEKLALFVTHT
jgi:hypothetical protein